VVNFTLIPNRGYDEPKYGGSSNWGVCNIRIDAPEANGIMPAHAKSVRLENIYGDRIYYHHIDIVSSKNVVVDGYWATRGGEGNSDAPIQFDNQTEGTTANGVWDGDSYTLAANDGTPTSNCALRTSQSIQQTAPRTVSTSTATGTRRSRLKTAILSAVNTRRFGLIPARCSRI